MHDASPITSINAHPAILINAHPTLLINAHPITSINAPHYIILLLTTVVGVGCLQWTGRHPVCQPSGGGLVCPVETVCVCVRVCVCVCVCEGGEVVYVHIIEGKVWF